MSKFFLSLILALPLGAAINCTNSSGDVNAINTAVSGGGTVTITGSCNLTANNTVQINNAVTITGSAILTGNGGLQYGSVMMSVNSDNVSISGLTFTRGTGISITGTVHSNINILNNTFSYTNGSDAIYSNAFLKTSSISHNNFDHIAPDSQFGVDCRTWGGPPPPGGNLGDNCNISIGTGISILPGIDQTKVEYNNCDNYVIECIHMAWNAITNTGPGYIGYYATTGNSISYNTMRLVHRYGIELQGNTNYTSTCQNSPGQTPNPPNCTFQLVASINGHVSGNYYRSPWLSYYNTYCNSWVDDQQALYTNNTCVYDATHGTSANYGGPGLGFEVQGFNPNYRGNVYIGQPISGNQSFNAFLVEPSQGTFTVENNVLAFTGAPSAFPANCSSGTSANAMAGYNPPCSLTGFAIDNNYLSSTPPILSGSTDLTAPYISISAPSNSTSGSTITFNIGVLSQLGVRNVQWF